MDPTRRGRREEKKESDGTAGLILIVLILIIVIAASIPALLPSGSAAADRLPIFLNIGGGSEDGEGGSGTGLRLSIITDFFNNLFAPEEGTFLLSSTGGTPGQVRTLPPEFTDTPSGRATETVTPTGTVIAFGTAGPSPTPSMTGTPGPTRSPTDSKNPQISGGSFSPGSGASISCTTNVSITGLVVHDPDHSSGMDHVQLKYQIDGSGFVYGPELTLVSGGWTTPGKTWQGTYDGGIKIDHSGSLPPTATNTSPPTFTATATQTVAPTLIPTNTPTATATSPPIATSSPVPTEIPTTGSSIHSSVKVYAYSLAVQSSTLTVEVYANVEDNAGNTAVMHVATYYIPASCP